MMAASADLSRSKQDFAGHLAVLTVLLTDVLYLNEGLPEKLVNVDMRERMQRLASRLSSERVIRLGEFLRFIETSLKSYVNRQMLTDVLALTANETASKILHDNESESR
jgi:hypothetical protein